MNATDINTAIKSLSPTTFENFAYDFARKIGISNLVWRTPGADGGRDIEGIHTYNDPTGQQITQKWYIECKRYTSAAIDWPTVFEKISYSVVDCADVLWIITSSNFSTQCLSKIAEWNAKNFHPKIRHWALHDIASHAALHNDICLKYQIPTDSPKIETVIFDLMMIGCKLGTSISNSVALSVNPGIDFVKYSQCMYDLIFTRMDSIKRNGIFIYTDFSAINDSTGGIKNTSYIDTCQLDRTGLRALLSSIQFYSKRAEFEIQITADCCRILIREELICKNARSAIDAICNVSNFSITYDIIATIRRM